MSKLRVHVAVAAVVSGVACARSATPPGPALQAGHVPSNWYAGGAVAVAEVEGPAAGLRLVDETRLEDYHLFHAIRADLLRRLGRSDEAAIAYAAASDRTENAAERAFLERQRSASRIASLWPL